MRYSKQTKLKEIGREGQNKLTQAKITIVGCGGLGSIVAPYLAGAGIGNLTLIDADTPDLTNLHRQVFFKEGEQKTKSKALADHIQLLNSEVVVTVIEEMISKNNIGRLFQNADLVIECTDDMMTKYLVNDYCHLKSIPLVYGAIYKFDGYVSLFENEDSLSIHLRDIFPEPDLDVPSCSEIGVINTIAGLIGLMQANEAIKYVLGIGQTLNGKLLTYNALTNDQLKLKLKKNWKEDIEEIYRNTFYDSIHCINVPEISYKELQENSDNYTVISILEDDEHQNVFDGVKRMPLSTFNSHELKVKNKPIVFYCMSGKRSSVLVEKLISEKSDLSVFSLKGGLKDVLVGERV